MSVLATEEMSVVETGRTCSSVETEQMFVVETGQMSAAEAGHMSSRLVSRQSQTCGSTCGSRPDLAWFFHIDPSLGQ